ncbi:NHL domain-containing protein isoform 2 [Hibiscus syriacus]|uniref:NHL domain-containing protein isoform 2 n=1 Tax=Hibiscus syriacus TaxID=106335 RepID=A0A6A2Z7M6_HIBSY|nr:NHL domain-containing protein isoform 2 [Hibiscus syriacus]
MGAVGGDNNNSLGLKLLAGSPEGYPGHVHGKPREARMNHPKGLAVDDRGNIYIADTMNMAIRKISNAGVTTISGGKLTQGRGHADGPGEDAKEIQLHFDDCANRYGSGFPLGIGVLVAAGFFGYMLGLLQRRVGTIVSSKNANAAVLSLSTYQTPSIIQHQQQQKHTMPWPAQESFVIPDDDEHPSIDTRPPTPRKAYPLMSKDAKKIHQLFHIGWNSNTQQQRYRSSIQHTCIEQSHEKSNEIVSGAVQEQNRKHESIVVKPVYHGDNMYDYRNDIHFRSN